MVSGGDIDAVTYVTIVERARLEARQRYGRDLTPDEEEELEYWRGMYAQEMLSQIRSKGFPSAIRAMMLAPGKAEKERLAKRLVITGSSFQQLIINCDIRGYSHRTKSLEHVPEHLRPTSVEFDTMLQPNPETREPGRKFLRKAGARFKERRCPTVHMFEKGPDEWHAFYFSYEDALHEDNHWEHGKHIHYLAHDFGLRMTREEVWATLEQRKASLPALHVRFTLKL